MIVKEVIDNQLYVYMNGELLYKRWINRGYGMVFNPNNSGWGPFTAKDTESFKQLRNEVSILRSSTRLSDGCRSE